MSIDKNQNVSEEGEKIKSTPYHNHMPISKSDTIILIGTHVPNIFLWYLNGYDSNRFDVAISGS